MDDENTIDIRDLDEAEVIAALHNGTSAMGMGRLHDLGRDITAEEVRASFKDDGASMFGEAGTNSVWNGKRRFDYFHGRPLKVWIGCGQIDGVLLYDRDAGPGACKRAIEALRAKKNG